MPWAPMWHEGSLNRSPSRSFFRTVRVSIPTTLRSPLHAVSTTESEEIFQEVQPSSSAGLGPASGCLSCCPRAWKKPRSGSAETPSIQGSSCAVAHPGSQRSVNQKPWPSSLLPPVMLRHGWQFAFLIASPVLPQDRGKSCHSLHISSKPTAFGTSPVQQRERTMESRRLGDVDAFRMPSLERAAEQALSEICKVRVEGDLVGVVDVPIEPLVLVISAGCDSAPRQLKVLLALRAG